MKILFLTNHCFPYTKNPIGGAEKLIFYLAKKLAENGHEVNIITKKIDENVNEYYQGISYTFLAPGQNILKGFYLLQEIIFSYNVRNYINSIPSFDCIIAFFHTPILLPSKYKGKIFFYPFYDWFTETMTTKRTIDTHKINILKKFHIRIAENIHFYFIKRSINKSKIILTEGQFQTKMMVNAGFASKECLVDFGVGVDVESIEKYSFNIQPCKGTLVTANRLVDEKGIDVLIKAIHEVLKRGVLIKLIIIGDGQRRKYLEDLVSNLNLTNNVIFKGRLSEEKLYLTIAGAELYISPTFHDDWVTGIAEAMALSKPIISTGQEWLVQNGINGFLCTKGDSIDMTNAIIKFTELSNEKKQLFAKKSYDIVQEYSISKLTDKLINLIKYKNEN